MTNRKIKDPILLEDDPLWYKDAIIYELHVRAFCDSNADGIGDFLGLTSRLDYLQDLGVTALWLLPFYPSPLKDDGYDIAEYTSVNPIYGSINDFKVFLNEAHRRGLRVITELVLNHTSDQHPWFQKARRAAPGSPDRDFYVWSDTPYRYQDARIIFKDFESSNWTWDPVARAYYWHRFYSHQPDLNFENPKVKKALFQVVDFWFQMGVDGLRLDAVPYLYEEEGTSCENLPRTHGFLKELRAHVDKKFTNRMLLAEANQWPEDSVAYFGEGDGDECHMCFHFPLMPRIFMSMSQADRFPIIDILDQTPAIPKNAAWAVFLRNHDELTLEIVTDEERDYMYRMYALDQEARINLGIRRRLAPLLGNDRRQIELINALLFSLPGTPVIYYGDEIGMGDNIYLGDRNSVRTPFQWSADRNAGFSRANPQKLFLPIIIDPEYHYEALNAEAQQSNSHSLLWWMKRMIDLRKRHPALNRGELEFLHPENRHVLVFIRESEDETILVIANLRRHVEYVELDLSRFKDHIPVELMGGGRFPRITEAPYFITMAPHSFTWFSLEPVENDTEKHNPYGVPVLSSSGKEWKDILAPGKNRKLLAENLGAYLSGTRWFGGKDRKLRNLSISSYLSVGDGGNCCALTFLEADFGDGDVDEYLLPLAYTEDEERIGELIGQKGAAVAYLQGKSKGLLYDAVHNPEFASYLFRSLTQKKRIKGESGEISFWTSKKFKEMRNPEKRAVEPVLMRGEQSNSSIIIEDSFVLKLFRRVEKGVNPDLEVGRYLSEEGNFHGTPPLAGAIEITNGRGEPTTLGVMQGFLHGVTDAWSYTADRLKSYFENLAVFSSEEVPDFSVPEGSIIDLLDTELSEMVMDRIGSYLETARLLGQRTAELHLALGASPDHEVFGQEGFTPLYQRSLYQSMRNLLNHVSGRLKKAAKNFPPELVEKANEFLASRDRLQDQFSVLTRNKIHATRIRTHGDFHLGQVLYTGKDFQIIDFEGEPVRSLGERRMKRSPLRDVAGMIRSFHYASFSAVLEKGHQDPVKIERAFKAAKYWYTWVSVTYLRAYMDGAGEASFIPASREELQMLLDLFLTEKAVYELGYELGSRPDWALIPLEGILELVKQKSEK